MQRQSLADKCLFIQDMQNRPEQQPDYRCHREAVFSAVSGTGFDL